MTKNRLEAMFAQALMSAASDPDSGIGVVRVPSKNGFDVSISLVGQKANLDEQYDAYMEAKQGCIFQVGQYVTPKAMMSIKGVGNPHKVVEVRDASNDTIIDGVSSSSPHHGNRQDMRVLTMIDDESIVGFWVESWQYCLLEDDD